MGAFKKIGKSIGGALTGTLDTLGGKPTYTFDPNAYISPEVQKQIDFANAIAKQNLGQTNVAEQAQLEARKNQIQVAKNLGQISDQQAQIALAGLNEQAGLATQQQQNISALTAQADGTGPSLAQDALTNATDRNIKQITGQIASQRGVPTGLAMRTGVNAIGDANQKAASDAATLRLQEQLAAREQLAGALANTRNQAAGQQNTATQNQIQTKASEGDAFGNVRTGDINTKQLADTNLQKQQSLASTNAENQRQAKMELEKNRAGLASDARKAQSEMVSGLGAGAAAAGASDKKVKKDIKPAEKKIESFLDALNVAKKSQPELFSNKNKLTLSDEEKKKYIIPAGDKIQSFLDKTELPKMEVKKPSSPDLKGATSAESLGKTLGYGLGKSFGFLKSKMASDEDLKTDVSDSSSEVDSFLNALGKHQYKYKESAKGMPGVDDREHISPMAQEFEKTEMGKNMVIDTPKGKVVDYAKSAGALFSSLSHLNDKIKKLEKGKK